MTVQEDASPANGAEHGDPLDRVLALDIGGTHLRIGLVDRALRITDFEIIGSARLLGGERPIDDLSDYISAYLSTRTSTDAHLRAITLGFPATIDRARTRILSTTNLPALQNVSVVERLEATFGIPAIIDRDVNNLLRYDMQTLDLPREGIVIGCYVGTGLGNAISVDGSILVGRHGVAGELGHIPQLHLTGICGCGNVGCVETVASGRYLADLADSSGGDLVDVFHNVAHAHELGVFFQTLAVAIATEINILDPEAIVLGGGVIQTPEFSRTRLETLVRTHTRHPLPAAELDFLYSRGGQQAGVIGAAVHAWTRASHSLSSEHPLLSSRRLP